MDLQRSIDTKKLRELRGELTQEFVAEKIGVTKGQLSHYERGISEPSLSILVNLLSFYKVSFDDIVRDEIKLKFVPEPCN